MAAILISLGFWSLTLLVLLKLAAIAWQQHGGRTSPFRGSMIACGLLLLVALPLLMRPHEDIFGGQDTGAYANMGARLGREHQLLYTDPLLSLVPPDARSDFYYYPKQTMYPTKYGSGAVLDEGKAIVGNWFQPAMAIAMSLPAALAGPRAVLFITPLFTLCMALALATLATMLIPRRGAGVITALCFLACPIVLWHGRCPRPEMTAGFLLFAGAAIMLHAFRGPKWKHLPDIALGAACISLAPLFHVIAWSPAIVAAGIVTVIILSGRTDFLLYPLIAALAFAIFVLQITTIVDTYGLARYISRIINYPIIFVGVFSAGIAALGVWSALVARGRIRTNISIFPKLLRLGAPASAAAVLIASLGVYAYARQHPPSPHASPGHFVHATDLSAVINMISPAIGILALIGLVTLALRRPTRSRLETGAFLLLVALPSLGIGYLYDFFMVRYTLVALLPTVAIGLASLITMIPERGRVSQIVVALFTGAICATGLVHRTHLVTTVDYRGFAAFIQKAAEPIIREEGILLGEYSRLAAPFDHFSGIPTLGLNNEIHTDYTRAEASWVRIMETLTNRPAFFVTPFTRPPISEHFDFEYVSSSVYEGERLIGRRWGLPTQTAPWGCHLKLYRMRLANPQGTGQPPPAGTLAFGFDPGNMGLRDFANCRTFNTSIMGRELASESAMTIPLPTDTQPNAEIWLILHARPDQEALPDTVTEFGGQSQPSVWQRVAPDWWLCRVRIPGTTGANESPLTLRTQTDNIFLTTARLVDGLKVTPLINGWERLTPSDPLPITLDSRWARKGSRFTLPAPPIPSPPGEPCAYLCTLIAGPEEVGPLVSLSIGSSPESDAPRQVPTGKWIWEVWPLGSEQPSQRVLDVVIDTDTPFDPQDSRYPTDLAVLMSYVAEVPLSIRASDERE